MTSLVPKEDDNGIGSALLARFREMQAGTMDMNDKDAVTIDTIIANMDSRSRLKHETALRVIFTQLAREGKEGSFGVGLHQSDHVEKLGVPIQAQMASSGSVEHPPLLGGKLGTIQAAGMSGRQQVIQDISSLAPYAYEPLPTLTSIRVLEVIGNDPVKTPDVPIQCKLHIVDLSDDPEYNALSYVWGSPRLVYRPMEEIPDIRNASIPSHAIVCDGKKLMVTRNAYDFLQTAVTSQYALTHYVVGELPPHMRTFRLWIDAICIDQKNIPERNAQVEMMAAIYRRARSVFVWLGAGGWFVKSAERALNSIIELLKKFDQRGYVNFTAIDIFDTAWWRTQQIPEPGDWIGLYVFLQHAWFHRSWIVQEVALTGRATLFCGFFQMRFEVLSACLGFLLRHGWLAQMERVRQYCVHGTTFSGHAARYLSQVLKHNHVDTRGFIPPEWADAQLVVPSGKLQELSTFLDPIITIASLGGNIKRKGRVDADGHASILRNVLEICRNFDATMPHDKIYAFLSIAEEALKEARAIQDRPIKVAYEKSADEVYIETTAYLLTSSKHMMDRQTEVMWQIEDKTARKISNLPSWVPDFSVECLPALIEDKVAHDWNVWPLEGRPDKNLVIDGRTLHAYGVMIDKIIEVAPLEGDRFRGAAKVALGLPAVYRCIGDDVQEQVDRDGQEAEPQDVVSKLIGQVTSEDFLKVQHDWHQHVPQLSPAPVGEASKSQMTRAAYRRQLRPARGTPHVSSPRRQTRVEAFWRTLLLDYSFDESPAPLESGFALGDMLADRIHEKQVLHLLFRDEASLNDLKDELVLWQELAAGEPGIDETMLTWPACDSSADDTLMQYTEVDTLARALLSARRDLSYLGMTPQQYSPEDIRQLAAQSEMDAISLPSVRFLPTQGQIGQYILSDGRIPESGLDSVTDKLAAVGIQTHDMSAGPLSSALHQALEPRPEKPKRSSRFSFLKPRKDGESSKRASRGLKGWLHRGPQTTPTSSNALVPEASAHSTSALEATTVEAPNSFLELATPSPEAEQIRRTRQVNFLKQYHKYEPGRRIFRTKKGWMGYGHQSACAGDEVWFLTRCTAPFVLRPCGGEGNGMAESRRYEMVGVCYLHGLMNREESQGEWMRVEEDLVIV